MVSIFFDFDKAYDIDLTIEEVDKEYPSEFGFSSLFFQIVARSCLAK